MESAASGNRLQEEIGCMWDRISVLVLHAPSRNGTHVNRTPCAHRTLPLQLHPTACLRFGLFACLLTDARRVMAVLRHVLRCGYCHTRPLACLPNRTGTRLRSIPLTPNPNRVNEGRFPLIPPLPRVKRRCAARHPRPLPKRGTAVGAMVQDSARGGTDGKRDRPLRKRELGCNRESAVP